MGQSPAVYRLQLPAVPEQAPVLSGWLESRMAELAVPLKAQQQLLIAADEIFANIASYAYGDTPGEVQITLAPDPMEKMLEITFSDRGIPFDPLAKAPPDVTEPLEHRSVGGLGILVVRKMMDQVAYRREDGQNLLTVRKRFGGGAQ